MQKVRISLNLKILAAVVLPTAGLFLAFVLWLGQATTDALRRIQEETTSLVAVVMEHDLIKDGAIDAASAQANLHYVMQRFDSVLRVNVHASEIGKAKIIASSEQELIETGSDLRDLCAILPGIPTRREGQLNGVPVMEALVPIRYGDRPIGALGIYFSMEKGDSLVAQYRLQGGLTAAGIFVLILLTQWMLMRHTILRPISALAIACRNFALGNLDYRVPERHATLTYDELDGLIEAYNQMGETIRMDRQRIEELAAYDDLTGLLNHRAFFQRLEEEVQRSRRYRHPLSLLIIDGDRFKGINDRFGHLVGDQVLRHFSLRILTPRLRTPDIAARYGGDEFAVILPETDKEGALSVAQRVLDTAQIPIPLEDHPPVMFPVSIGVATLPEDGDSAEALVTAADNAMYRAKRAGGRRAFSAQSA